MAHDDGDGGYRFTLAESRFSFEDEGYPTYTSVEQKRAEDMIRNEKSYHTNRPGNYKSVSEEGKPLLLRELHKAYIESSLENLSKSYMSMDASRAWFCFWGLHSLRILGYKPRKDLQARIIEFIKSCEAPEGGYGGGPTQLPHLATTYAAVMALISIGTPEAFECIDRRRLYKFINSMRQPNGSFVLHEGGEIDIRGAYCAIAAACITNIVDDVLFQNTATWLISCQTYEGGFGGSPNCEAHGGYTSCGVNALALLRKSCLVNSESALNWLVNRQMQFEGGFNGRTNKLVDGCYSYWQAATFFTLEYELSSLFKQGTNVRGLFDHSALENYILVVCQDIHSGGLRDKPDKKPDLYHTCYCLAGLSIAQSYAKTKNDIVGGFVNAVEDVHHLYNVCMNVETLARAYFLEHPYCSDQ
ncbi:prenyltransferase and squalene oxidase repeat domain-containing protein [Ditylenchus destructor]|nr:prenyltransferase and squalene oxidase repeat domain-containing protein [Ditylenchus destructor]